MFPFRFLSWPPSLCPPKTSLCLQNENAGGEGESGAVGSMLDDNASTLDGSISDAGSYGSLDTADLNSFETESVSLSLATGTTMTGDYSCSAGSDGDPNVPKFVVPIPYLKQVG